MSVLGTYLYQCTRWRCCERLHSASVHFFKALSTCLLISWWVIYQCTCPECSAVFDEKQRDPHAPPSLPYSPGLAPGDFFFCFLERKKSSKGNILPTWKRWNKKVTEALKDIRIDKFKNCCEQWKKVLIGVLHQMESTWRWPKFKHVRINTIFNK